MFEIAFACQTYNVFLTLQHYTVKSAWSLNDIDEAATIHGKLQYFTYIAIANFALGYASFFEICATCSSRHSNVSEILELCNACIPQLTS